MLSSCSNITDIADPIRQCEAARQHCQLESIVPYATLIFCKLSRTFIRIALLSIIVMLNFAAMGVAAFDYLSPNLTRLAEISGLSESLMGVTVLAFGNGSVDVFGALVALNGGEGGMAFGEIMGGALFVCSVVVGSMAIISPFEVDPHFTLRDVGLLAVGICYTMFIVFDGVITLTEALVGLLLYVIYAVIVVRQQFGTDERPAIPRIEDPESRFVSPSLSHASTETVVTPLRPSLYSAVDIGWKVHRHLDEFGPGPLSPQPSKKGTPLHIDFPRRVSAPNLLSNHPPRIAFLPQSSQSAMASPELSATQYPHRDGSHFSRQQYEQSRTEPHPISTSQNLLSPHDLPKLDTRWLLENEAHPNEHGNHYSHHHHNKDFTMKHLVDRLLDSPIHNPAPERFGSSGEISTLDIAISDSCSEEVEEEIPWWRHVFPSFVNWNELTLLHKLNILVTFPIISALSWSIPLSSQARSRSRVCVYAVGVPTIFPIIMPNLSINRYIVISQVICIATGLLWWGRLKKPLPSALTMALLGFFMGLLWVLLLATELVAVFTVLGEVCHVSDTMMGLTVFALGGSLGDFVSNITVARIGFPTMAISACFGGPIFTLLVGVSGASLFNMICKQTSRLEVPVASSLLFSGAGLLTVLTVFTVLVRWNKNIVTKSTGICLICIWAIVVIGSMLISKYTFL